MGKMQFSIRTLLAAVAAVGIGAALWTAKPSWQIGFLQTLMVVAMPACFGVAAVQHVGCRRAFCMGAAFASAFPTFIYLFHVTTEMPVSFTKQEVQLLSGLSSASLPFNPAYSPGFYDRGRTIA